jgi:hypothetical protein
LDRKLYRKKIKEKDHDYALLLFLSHRKGKEGPCGFNVHVFMPFNFGTNDIYSYIRCVTGGYPISILF